MTEKQEKTAEKGQNNVKSATVCPECGKAMTKGDKVCASCGSRVYLDGELEDPPEQIMEIYEES